MINVIPLVSQNYGCDYHRIIIHLQIIRERYKDELSINTITLMPDKTIVVDFDNVDVVIYNRFSKIRFEKLLELREKRRFKIICDLDDYWEVYDKHLAANLYKRGNLVLRQIENLKAADMVWTTHTRLADLIKPYNKNVEILPNSIPFEFGQFISNEKQPSERIRFIYAGESSHEKDLSILRYPFQRIDQEIMNKAQFIMAGYIKNTTGVWDRMEAHYSLDGKLPYKRVDKLPIESYMNLYNEADVSL
ncbi:hypothetical protein, partial [Arachidicoccus sp.]|uniref:hypothetical protein n=1 Tax=Arachidicoccus sp. TaxID=1872624 RepID=UPI003D213801